jgi:ribonuclease P protein component
LEAVARPAPGTIEEVSRALEEAMREENVPAEQPQAKQEARFPPADAVEGRASGAAPSPDQGPLPPVGLIWPIRERSSFRALATGRRRRRGVVMVTSAVVGSPTEPPRVAYAVGRHAGGAVARNKIRRRLRAATRAHARELEPGRAYLVGVVGSRAAPAPYASLSDSLAAALRALREEKP